MKIGNIALMVVGVLIGLIIMSAFLGSNITSTLNRQESDSSGAVFESLLAPGAAEEKSTSFGIGRDTATSEDVSSNSFSSESSSKASRLVIKKGTSYIVVGNIPGSVEKIKEYTKKEGGWVVSSNVVETEGSESGDITVRVPVDKFDSAMEYIKSVATKVNYQTVEGKDVTEEYTDLTSKLKNLEETEKQFLAIMKRAKTIDEILKVQNEIKTIRGEIEYTKGEILYLDRSASYSEISATLALAENLLPVPESEQWKPGYIAKKAWQDTVQFWKNISYGLIEIVVYHLLTWIAFLLIIVLVLWKPIKALLRKLTERKGVKKNSAKKGSSQSDCGLVSMTCGIVGIFLIFGNPILGFVAGMVALVLGIKGGRTGYAKVGFILGIIVLVLSVIAIIVVSSSISMFDQPNYID